ncbi:MAG: hypothetical protein A2289_18300 [Deltaproteobacteria bacterium RIFOXYA12_FULL_58_15]|nr:MAG: hypothetical protein A2289_18300 [Deltaproteobacteria bacterium RIFOXYA12_FULL_58_15]OGR09679.1 MAG: hypothetical protein A2341_15030 [Deltaproteobacteria bacterium RIFOXYB12_FULL_58_9]
MNIGIVNPSNMVGYDKAIESGLVDKSYQKKMDKMQAKAKEEGNVGWSADLEFNKQAPIAAIKGIGSKYAAALGEMNILNFATTRGGLGFELLAGQIGKEGVTNLRNLQQALKACMA